MTLPAGFEWTHAGYREAFARPEAADFVRESLEREATLWLAARKAGPERTLQGRAPLMVVRAADGSAAGDASWVIRRYWRGGAMRSLEDRHLRWGPRRPVVEAQASERLRERGVDTPRVVAGAAYRSGLFYRADLVTEYVPDTVDVATLLFSPEEPWRSDPDLRLGALARVGGLVRRLADAGGRHPDLNARNLMVRRTDDGGVPLVIDLDRCRVEDESVEIGPLLDRLERSVRKVGSTMGAPFPREAWSILARATERVGA